MKKKSKKPEPVIFSYDNCGSFGMSNFVVAITSTELLEPEDKKFELFRRGQKPLNFDPNCVLQSSVKLTFDKFLLHLWL